jgi:hypothetical protein
MDKESATRQIAAIKQALEDVTKDLDVYLLVIQDGIDGTDLESKGKLSQSYEDLLAGVRALNRAVRWTI